MNAIQNTMMMALASGVVLTVAALPALLFSMLVFAKYEREYGHLWRAAGHFGAWLIGLAFGSFTFAAILFVFQSLQS